MYSLSNFKFILLFLLLNLIILGQSEDFSPQELRHALDTFMDKPIQDPRDPLVIWLLENHTQTNPHLLALFNQQDAPSLLRAWLAFYPSLLPKENSTAWIPSLIQSLQDPYWRVRTNACLTLGRIQASHALAPLCHALRDPEIWVRNAAQDSIRKILTPQNCKILQQQFNQQNQDYQSRIILLLASCPTPETQTFLEQIAAANPLPATPITSCDNLSSGTNKNSSLDTTISTSSHPTISSPAYSYPIRSLAMSWLVQTQTQLPDWQERLHSPDPATREQTLRWLSRNASLPNPTIQQPPASAIQPLLKDENMQVRLAALWVLATLPPESAAPVVCKFIQDNNITWPELITAVTILGMLGDSNALAFYQQLQSNPKLTEFELMQLLYGLAGIPQPEAAQILQTWSQQNSLAGEMARTMLDEFSIQPGKLPSVRNRHYEIYSNIGWNSLHEAAILMESFQYNYHQQFQHLLNITVDAQIQNSERAKIYLFRWQKDFQEHIRTTARQWIFLQETRAYYIPDRAEIVSYLDGNPNELWACLAHELSHQILHQHWQKIPIWLDEGTAELYTTSIPLVPAHWMPNHLQILHRGLVEGTLTPLDCLIQLDSTGFHNDFGPQEAIHYAQAWSLVQFFHKAQQGKYRQVLLDYLQAIQNSKNPTKCWKEVLEKHQLTPERLQTQWQAYICQLIREWDIH